MLIIFDRQDVFTYLKLLINSHNLKVIYEAHAQDFVASHRIFCCAIDLSFKPSKFYAQRKILLIYCAHQNCYFYSSVLCPGKEKWYMNLVSTGTWSSRKMLDWIQFQLAAFCCHSLVLGSLYVYSFSFLFSPMLF